MAVSSKATGHLGKYLGFQVCICRSLGAVHSPPCAGLATFYSYIMHLLWNIEKVTMPHVSRINLQPSIQVCYPPGIYDSLKRSVSKTK